MLDKKPRVADVSLNSQLSTVKPGDVVSRNQVAIDRKFPTKMQPLILMFAALTGMLLVLAVVNVKVGRREPTPNPTIVTPATLKGRAVLLVIVSAWPGRMTMTSSG